jgi:hypothetical protein
MARSRGILGLTICYHPAGLQRGDGQTGVLKLSDCFTISPQDDAAVVWL